MKRILTVLFLCCYLPLYAAGLQYSVIIDAGSSGSRAHVFAFGMSLPMIPIPVIKDKFNQNTHPGLSSYANNPAAAGQSLEPILQASAAYLRQVPSSRVPISVLGTAGMRLLTTEQQAAIYASVRQYIRKYYADIFLLQDQDVRTITGTMEGIYGWLDINYLLNNFVQTASSTKGSIDMGGASTQIAFATTDTSKPNQELLLTLNHTTYRVFSISFLGLGQDQARITMNTYPASPSCYPAGYPYGSNIGNFDFPLCSDTFTSVIQSYQVAEQLIPTTGTSFIAYSGIYFNYQFFSILDTPTQAALQSQIHAICYETWDEMQHNYPHVPPVFLANECANGVYFDDLLYNTYQLQHSQLQVMNEINHTGIDWTLGALLYSLTQ